MNGEYLPVRAVGGSMAIAVCGRCNMKVYNGDLMPDPNTGLRVCKGCCDEFDPWRKPARPTENIALQHPRPDVNLE